VSAGALPASVRGMESETTIRDADLALLLAEPDRDEPYLIARRPEALEPREALDEQILAGLVKPW
jgi:hypothetical protein